MNDIIIARLEANIVKLERKKARLEKELGRRTPGSKNWQETQGKLRKVEHKINKRRWHLQNEKRKKGDV